VRTILVFALLIAWYAITSAEVIDLTYGGIDLGRHLKNGELLLFSASSSELLHTNFYSYTQPGVEFINHHWLAGVVFFAVWKYGGFAGLNAFYILLGALAFAIALRMAQRAAGLAFAAALALAAMPILRLRASVRPEIFTLLLSVVFLWLLWKHHEGKLSWRALLLLPALEVLWVNLHIGFIFGPIFIAAFLLADLLERPQKPEETGPNPWESKFYREKVRRLGRWLGILALTLAATLLNPSGIQGAVYPLFIWTNYGIAVIENLSVPFLESHHYEGEFTLIKLTLLALYLSFMLPWRRSAKFPTALFVLAIIIGAMAWTAIRNQTLLALFALPAIGINAGRVRPRKLALRLIMLGGVYYNGRELLMRKESLGLNLKPGVDAGAKFLQAAHIEGPVLNNFNISGYFIHYLFPQYRPYVDSRPEAYTATFLQEQYQAPLNDESQWTRLLDQHAFNAIFFSWSSPWENEFLARRASDPAWAPVFADKTTIILLKRTAVNQSLIARYEIPKQRLLWPSTLGPR
jgi:hypothetical protein